MDMPIKRSNSCGNIHADDLPGSITHEANIMVTSWLRRRSSNLDTLSVHSDDVTATAATHVSRKPSMIQKIFRIIHDHRMIKMNSLDNLTEALAINHDDNANVFQRCATCYILRSPKDINRQRIAVITTKQAKTMEHDTFDVGYRNFSCHMSPVSLYQGQVRTEICLDRVSYLPLLVDVKDGQLIILVDGTKRHCSVCNSTRRVCIPYRLGSLDLPIYMDTSRISLTYVPDTDVLIIEGVTKGLQLTPPKTGKTKSPSLTIRCL